MALFGSWDSDTYRLRSKLVTSARNVHTSRRYRRRNMCCASTTPSSVESSSAAARRAERRRQPQDHLVGEELVGVVDDLAVGGQVARARRRPRRSGWPARSSSRGRGVPGARRTPRTAASARVNRLAGQASSRSISCGSARAASSCSRALAVLGTNGSSMSRTTRLSGYSCKRRGQQGVADDARVLLVGRDDRGQRRASFDVVELVEDGPAGPVMGAGPVEEARAC